MRFGSREWIDAMVAAINAHPDLPAALSGLGKDGALVVEADPPAWPRTVAAWAEQKGGRIGRYRLLADEDELLELEPAYVIRAQYRVVRSLMAGEDPVKAALSGRVRVEGDLEALIRRAQYRHVVDAALAVVVTELP
ncbi:MAG: hypothetical protein QM767_16765 [Anaeromyxobacter sp.]